MAVGYLTDHGSGASDLGEMVDDPLGVLGGTREDETASLVGEYPLYVFHALGGGYPVHVDDRALPGGFQHHPQRTDASGVAHVLGGVAELFLCDDAHHVHLVLDNKIYLYDMKERYTRSIIIHWTIPDFNSSYTYIPSTLSGLYFFPYYTILQMDYSGYFKYNFGPKSMDMSILYNSDNDSHFTYDERFVEFTESYVTIHDGMITKQLQPFDPVNSIKSIPMNRSEYNVIKRLVLQQPIEDDT